MLILNHILSFNFFGGFVVVVSLVATLCKRVRQTQSRAVYFGLPGEADHGGGGDEEIRARRQQPHHILLR